MQTVTGFRFFQHSSFWHGLIYLCFFFSALNFLIPASVIGAPRPYTAEESVPLSFHQLLQPKGVLHGNVANLQAELSDYHQREVSIRGFLYQGPEGQWIISSEPNLRTCCVRAAGKVAQQIILSGNFIGGTQQHAVTLQGRFIVEPEWNTDGSLKQLYRLEQAVILSEPPFSWSNIMIVLVVLCSCFVVYLWVLRRKEKSFHE